MAQESYIIQAEKLGYQVGNQRLLHGINLKIKRGEHWLFYGMNGCGKTTLLSILAGYRQQTQGNLQIFGEPFSSENILRNRRRIGGVRSSFFDARYHHDRVLDIVLSGKFGTYGLDMNLNSGDYRRARTLLDVLGLAEKQDYSYDRLSKGQRQNVLIARAFMTKPEILLLDEPCSGLDVLAKARFMALVENLMQNPELTVIFVSHEINEVKKMFPNTLLLRNGRMFAQGKTEDLFTEERLSVFLQQKIQLNKITALDITAEGKQQGLNPQLFMGLV